MLVFLLYSCEARNLRVKMLGGCLCSTTVFSEGLLVIQWEHRVSDNWVRHLVFGTDSLPLIKMIVVNRLR